MIDITTIQTYPIAKPIALLQETNSNLLKENKIIKSVMIVLIAGVILVIGFQMVHAMKEEKKTKSQFEF